MNKQKMIINRSLYCNWRFEGCGDDWDNFIDAYGFSPQFLIDGKTINGVSLDDVFWDCVGTDNPCYPVGANLTTYRFAGIMSERANNEEADGTVEGQIKIIVHDTDGGSSEMTPVDPVGFVDIDFVTLGDTVMCVWLTHGTGTGWFLLSSHNALADTGVAEIAQD